MWAASTSAFILCSSAVKVYFYSRFNDRKPRIREAIIWPFKALFKYLGIERGQCARKRRSSENISANIKREPNAFCYAGPPGKDVFCKPGLNWCWALENSGPLSSIYGVMGQLGVSVALDHPTSESIFALTVRAQFISFYFRRGISGEKKNIYIYTFFPSFSFFFFFFILLVFQLGICSSMAHPTPFQNALEKSHLWFPLLIYFQKILQSDINCFDAVHLFVITHRCQLSCLVLLFFFFPFFE